jgi:hypothetical protein
MMRQPCFFVQNNRVQRVTIPVAQFAHQAGVALEDRSSFHGFNPEDCGIDWDRYHPVLPYGSVQFLRKLKQTLLAPYVLHEDESFASTTWQARLGEQLLNTGGGEVLASDVPDLLAHADLHIRPNAEDKAFHAKVFDAPAWAAVVKERDIKAELTCWASPVKAILAEWRCWLVGGEMVEVSQYRHNGQMARERGAPVEVHTFVGQIARQWLPAPCVVMDVALTPEGLHVLEFNPIHGSGWYAAEPAKVLRPFLDWTCRQTP